MPDLVYRTAEMRIELTKTAEFLSNHDPAWPLLLALQRR